MREIVFDRFGGPDVLTLIENAPDPVPGPGELLIDVDYVGLNPLDYKIRDGSSDLAKQLTLPAGAGREMVGTVAGAAAGADESELAARGLEVGTRVFGMRANMDLRGTAAERVAMSADDLAPVPDSTTPERLPLYAGLALTGLTALAALEDAAQLQEGQTVLVHGGTGGVGQMLIPLALRLGASRVWATGRAANAQRIRDLGAEPIAYDTEDWEQAIDQATDGRGVDVILDTHYFSTFVPSLDHVADGGVIVALPSLADLTPAKERGIRAEIPRIRPGRDRLDQLVAALRNGDLQPEVSRILPLAQIGAAHELLEQGHTRGKLVLDAHA